MSAEEVPPIKNESNNFLASRLKPALVPSVFTTPQNGWQQCNAGIPKKLRPTREHARATTLNVKLKSPRARLL